MKAEKVVKDIQVVNVSNVPALYFFRPKVVSAIRAEILHDIRQGGKVRVPAGCRGKFGPPSLWYRLRSWVRSTAAQVRTRFK